MTEDEWLADANPYRDDVPLVATSYRKRRLYCVACCRRVSEWFHDPRWHEAVNVAEKYADRKVRLKTLEKWSTLVFENNPPAHPPGEATKWASDWIANHALNSLMHYDDHVRCNSVARDVEITLVQEGRATADEIRPWLCRLSRDIFGNPFRTVPFDPEWRSSTAVAVARQMYESREFSAMPILADALQDAGCDNDDVLNHCRGDGVHVRGCWVVDLVLGKA